MLSDLIKKKVNKPPVIVLYGDAGAGKSTIGTTFPKPLFLDLDDGLRAFDVPSIPISSLDELDTAISEIEQNPEDFKTIIIDTIDEVENLLTPIVCQELKVKSLIGTKYGEGFVKRSEYLNEIIDRIIALKNKDLIPVFLCHSKIELVISPEAPDYNYRTLKLQKNAGEHLKECADLIGYVGNIIIVDSAKNAIEDTPRCIQIGFSPSHLSKARVINAPETLDMNGKKIISLFLKKDEKTNNV